MIICWTLPWSGHKHWGNDQKKVKSGCNLFTSTSRIFITRSVQYNLKARHSKAMFALFEGDSVMFEQVRKLIVSSSSRNFLQVTEHHTLAIPSSHLCFLLMSVRHLECLHWWLEWFLDLHHVLCIVLPEYSCYCGREHELRGPHHSFGLLSFCSYPSTEILTPLWLSREGLLSKLYQSPWHKI